MSLMLVIAAEAAVACEVKDATACVPANVVNFLSLSKVCCSKALDSFGKRFANDTLGAPTVAKYSGSWNKGALRSE